MADRIKSKKYQGVYYRESKEVKHQGKPDKIYWITWYHAGKKQWLKMGSASRGISEEYAHRKRIDIMNRLDLGENPDLLTRKKAVALDAIVSAYFDWREAEGKHTKEDRCRYALHTKPAIGTVAVSTITPERLDALKTELLKKLSATTVKKIFSLLRAAINHAIKRKKFSGSNPFSAQANFSMPREDNMGERFLTPKEAVALLSELEKRSTQLYHMAFVALHTGMRATELFGLKGSDINKKDYIATITAKGGERETVFLPPDVLAVLNSYCTTHDALLFPKSGGGRIKNISDTFNRAVDALGLNDSGEFTLNEKGKRIPIKITDSRRRVWFHTLRHTFASWLAQSGDVGIYELMKLMRHKRIEMTLRYAHLIPDKQREKLSIITNIIAVQRQSSEP